MNPVIVRKFYIAFRSLVTGPYSASSDTLHSPSRIDQSMKFVPFQMMGGKHQYSISPEEYIFAALNLYLDIIQILMYVLMIIGASRD